MPLLLLLWNQTSPSPSILQVRQVTESEWMEQDETLIRYMELKKEMPTQIKPREMIHKP